MTEPSENLSLFQSLRDTGHSASIITSYNAYLPFYEEVVLRRLEASGCSNNIVLMDSRQCTAALSDETTRPRYAGTRYSLIPIRDAGAFHPKIFLRLGRKKGSLFIGSHNLTIAGFGMNDELTNHFKYAQAGNDISPFVATVALLRDYLSQSPTAVTDSLSAAVSVAPWLQNQFTENQDIRVLGASSDAPSLWDQLRPLLSASTTRVLVLSPFFDEDFAFIQEVKNALPNAEIIVSLDPDTAHANFQKAQSVVGLRFVDVRGHTPQTSRREHLTPYLHAKAMVFDSPERAVLVTGSANASRSALLFPGRSRNTECIVVRKLDPGSSLIEDLGLRDMANAPELTLRDWESINSRHQASIQMNAADASSRSTVLAVLTASECELYGVDAESIVRIEAVDEEGTILGLARMVDSGSPIRVQASDQIWGRAVFLSLDDGTSKSLVIIHNTAIIAQRYASDRGRQLRQAIGALQEDPAQLDVLLKLSEKVIFDDDFTLNTTTVSARKPGTKTDAAETEPEPVESLALTATGRRSSRRSIASGDISVLIQALIHKLDRGGEFLSGGSRHGPSEEEAIDADDDSDDLPPAPINNEVLAKACRSKTKRLLSLVECQLNQPIESFAFARTITQVAAVLSVVRTLYIIQQREEWGSGHIRLVDLDSLANFFWEAAPLLAVGDTAVVRGVNAEHPDTQSEEVSIAVGLMVWVAWVIDVDLNDLPGQYDRPTVEENMWSWLQCLAYLAPYYVNDARAMEIAADSVRQTPKLRHAHHVWLEQHNKFMVKIAAIMDAPDHLQPNIYPPKPGDLVVLGERYDPRVRIVLNTVDTPGREEVTVLDEERESITRTFMANRVVGIKGF